MDKLFFEAELDNSLALMVIDIENKTNGELKSEIRKRVRKIINGCKQKALNSIESKDEYEKACVTLTELCNKEFNNIIKQFDMQIDQLVPVNIKMNDSIKVAVEV